MTGLTVPIHSEISHQCHRVCFSILQTVTALVKSSSGEVFLLSYHS